ncbi:MAG: hypothetical protein AAF299_08830 [Pseudomonadota bacterium]
MKEPILIALLDLWAVLPKPSAWTWRGIGAVLAAMIVLPVMAAIPFAPTIAAHFWGYDAYKVIGWNFLAIVGFVLLASWYESVRRRKDDANHNTTPPDQM